MTDFTKKVMKKVALKQKYNLLWLIATASIVLVISLALIIFFGINLTMALQYEGVIDFFEAAWEDWQLAAQAGVEVFSLFLSEFNWLFWLILILGLTGIIKIIKNKKIINFKKLWQQVAKYL